MKKNMKKHSFIKRTVCIILIIGCIITGVYSYYGVRAFSLEGDYGGCEAVNRYIHGGDGTVKDAVSAIGFAIYQTEEMEKIWNQDKQEYTDGYTAEQREKIIEDVKREFEEKDTLQNASAVHLADVLLQNMELGKYIDNAGEINIHRDKMMAKNIMWILKQEEARGNGRIFISGHNGHVKKSGNYDAMIYVSDAHPIKVIED